MNLQEYQVLAGRTFVSMGKEDDTDHLTAGLFTELGEMLDIYKANLAYKKPVDEVNVAEEWGDFMWYLVNLAVVDNVELIIDETFREDLKKIIVKDSNISKLIPMSNAIYNMTGDQEDFIIVLTAWYVVGELLGVDTEKALENNINKLKVRYPDTFTNDNALNRNLEAERAELEK